MTTHTLVELAKLLDAKLLGDGDCSISGVAPMDEAKSGDVTFLTNPKYEQFLTSTQASAVILTENSAKSCKTNALVMDNPYLGFAKVAGIFELKEVFEPGVHESVILGKDVEIHPSASVAANCVIGDGVKLAENVLIGAGCFVGDHAQIGSNSRLHPNVTLYRSVTIGERSVVHSHTVIGCDGFGLVKDNGVWHKIPQNGGVVIGNDVEIGACTTIDRGAIKNTILNNGVKLDNNIQIAHNVVIGEHTAVAASVGIAGSTTIGKHCIIGGEAAITGHIEICDNVTVTGGTGISKSIHQPGIYTSGTRFMEYRKWQKNAAHFRHFDDMAKRIKALEKLVTTLTEEQNNE